MEVVVAVVADVRDSPRPVDSEPSEYMPGVSVWLRYVQRYFYVCGSGSIVLSVPSVASATELSPESSATTV